MGRKSGLGAPSLYRHQKRFRKVFIEGNSYLIVVSQLLNELMLQNGRYTDISTAGALIRNVTEPTPEAIRALKIAYGENMYRLAEFERYKPEEWDRMSKTCDFIRKSTVSAMVHLIKKVDNAELRQIMVEFIKNAIEDPSQAVRAVALSAVNVIDVHMALEIYDKYLPSPGYAPPERTADIAASLRSSIILFLGEKMRDRSIVQDERIRLLDFVRLTLKDPEPSVVDAAAHVLGDHDERDETMVDLKKTHDRRITPLTKTAEGAMNKIIARRIAGNTERTNIPQEMEDLKKEIAGKLRLFKSLRSKLKQFDKGTKGGNNQSKSTA